MKITKTTTKTYEIYDCAKWQMTIGDTIFHREKVGLKSRGFDKCFCCQKKFYADYIPYLALVRGHTNQFICDECAEIVNAEKETSNANKI